MLIYIEKKAEMSVKNEQEQTQRKRADGRSVQLIIDINAKKQHLHIR